MATTVNYTPEQTANMLDSYALGASVESIAEALGKSVRSVVAKLSREGVYKAKPRTTRTGEPVVKKNELADAIGLVLKMSESEISGLAGSPKTALQKIFAALANSKPLEA